MVRRVRERSPRQSTGYCGRALPICALALVDWKGISAESYSLLLIAGLVVIMFVVVVVIPAVW
jgi:hypothetical protein